VLGSPPWRTARWDWLGLENDSFMRTGLDAGSPTAHGPSVVRGRGGGDHNDGDAAAHLAGFLLAFRRQVKKPASLRHQSGRAQESICSGGAARVGRAPRAKLVHSNFGHRQQPVLRLEATKLKASLAAALRRLQDQKPAVGSGGRLEGALMANTGFCRVRFGLGE